MFEIRLQYDGTFDGFLSLVFYAFENKTEPKEIAKPANVSQDLFSEVIEVETHTAKAERVWKGLVNKSSLKNARLISVAFMSELPGIEVLLWRYLKKVFTFPQKDFYQNMLDEDVYQVVQTARKVKKEVHRFHGFVRFQQTADNIWFAPIEPDHDIIPLLVPHFKNRYSGQPWVIYDTRRKYGIYYDTESVSEVFIEYPALDLNTGRLSEKAKGSHEDDYLHLWQQYYNSINIQLRENKKQMTRLMPRRYWKYLPERNR
ncbi:MAG: DNA metabolism protein [Bacteroidetes bacterium]|nr:MAG: DNA metabolism protein [Bacteroidota bacterium]